MKIYLISIILFTLFFLPINADEIKNIDIIRTSTSFVKDGTAPRKVRNDDWTFTRVFFDFNKDGIVDYFQAVQRYNLEQTPKTASPSDFELYLGTGKWDNVKQTSEFKLDTKILNGLGKGCIHPRKALINDFNLDGMQDIFIICHGWDKHPYPGEINKLILSQKNNRYKIIDASAKKGFYHGGASADFNGDRKPDVIVTNTSSYSNSSVEIWYGDGEGNFKPSKNNVPFGLQKKIGVFSITLPDVDGDGIFDLFVGGHEWENVPTTIFINDTENKFKVRDKIIIPKVEGFGTVLDALVTGDFGDKTVWILRTSGGNNTFYKGICIQEYHLKSQSSNLFFCERDRNWFPWLISWKSWDKKNYIGSSNLKDDFRLLLER